MAPAAAPGEAVVVLVVTVLESLAKHYDYNFKVFFLFIPKLTALVVQDRVKK
jgi:hypothetical protein